MAHEFTNIIGQEAKKPTTKGKQREPLLQSIFGWRRCEWRWISGTFAEKGQAMQFTLLKYPFQQPAALCQSSASRSQTWTKTD